MSEENKKQYRDIIKKTSIEFRINFGYNGKKPICPICKKEMNPLVHYLEDGSGYLFGWLCECTPGLRKEIHKGL